MKPAIFEEVENQLIDALADGSLDGVPTCGIVCKKGNSMYNYEEQLANLCDMRKAIINGLSLMGLTAQQIYDRLRLPYTEAAQQHIADATAHYDVLSKCISQCEELKYPPDSDVIVYYFDWDDGVCAVELETLLYFDSEYKGQKLVVSVDEIIPVILKPLMDEAIEAGDAQCIDRLAEAMVYVLTELQTQEAGDVN